MDDQADQAAKQAEADAAAAAAKQAEADAAAAAAKQAEADAAAAALRAETHDPETGIPFYHQHRLPADVVAAAGLRNGMTPAQVDEAVDRVLDGRLP